MTSVTFFISLARFCWLELPNWDGDGGYAPASAGRGRDGGCLSGECPFFSGVWRSKFLGVLCCGGELRIFFPRFTGVSFTGFSLLVCWSLRAVKLLLFIDDVS